jgi:hypothetical protein
MKEEEQFTLGNIKGKTTFRHKGLCTTPISKNKSALMSFAPLPPRKLKKLPPQQLQQQHEEVTSGSKMPQSPGKSLWGKLTKPNPGSQGTITPLSTSSLNLISTIENWREAVESSSSMQEPSLTSTSKASDVHSTAPTSITTAKTAKSSTTFLTAKTRQTKEEKRVSQSTAPTTTAKTAKSTSTFFTAKKRQIEEEVPSSKPTDGHLYIKAFQKSTMSEAMRTLRKSQVKTINKVLAEYERHTVLLNRTVHERFSSFKQAKDAGDELRLIEPAGRKLKLFLELINLEEEINENTILLKRYFPGTAAIEGLMTIRKRLQEATERAEVDFHNAYEELASRNRDELEELIWTIFDQYGDLVFDIWPLAWVPGRVS